MPFSLENYNVRINRGTELLRQLNDEVAAWQREIPEIINERTDDRTLYVSSVRFPSWPDMHRWAAIAGDAVANFRGSLDHLLRSIAVDASGQDPPPHDRQLQFPICDTERAFDDALRRQRLGKLTANHALVEGVRTLQPFETHSALARLRDLDDQHKHRTLAIGAYNVESFDVAMEHVGEAEVRITEGPVQQDGMLFGVKFPRPTDIGHVSLHVTIRLSFIDEPTPRRSMLQVLEDARQVVLRTRDVVMTVLGESLP